MNFTDKYSLKVSLLNHKLLKKSLFIRTVENIAFNYSCLVSKTLIIFAYISTILT